MHTDPDTQLMLDFKAGDEHAFQNLFDKYKSRVITYCFRFCRSKAVAEELAQETFLKVYKAAGRYRPKARFSTWLFKIATNVCLNELRRPVYRNRVESLDQITENEAGAKVSKVAATQQESPHAMLVHQEQQEMVHMAIEQLPEKQRAALLLRIEGEFSYGEIGQQINRSENHVKTLIHRGRMRLKKALAGYFGEHNG
jgi:RNA polymerase sigma-70 factor (ECF subfamily)